MKKFQDLLKNRKVVGAICAVAAVAVMGVGFYVNRGPEFPVHVDPIHEEKSDLVTPLSNGVGGDATTQPPTVETKTSTKTENKTVKLAKASSRTYTKNLGTKSSTKTTKSSTKDADIVTQDKTDVNRKETYTKGSKTKKVTQTTTLTRTITTTKKTAAGNEGTKGVSGGGGNSGKSTGDIYALATGMDTRVLSAFEALNCKVVVDPNFTGGNGQFDPNTGILTLQEENRGDALHELGHFVAFITGVSKKAPSAELKKIYGEEKGKFPGTFVKYATSTPDEFFAECTREYYLGGNDQKALKSNCPGICKLIEDSVASINSNLLGSARKYKN
jgi:hypothetical protein